MQPGLSSNSVCSQGWPLIHLSLLPKCWDCRYVPPPPAYNFINIFITYSVSVCVYVHVHTFWNLYVWEFVLLFHRVGLEVTSGSQAWQQAPLYLNTVPAHFHFKKYIFILFCMYECFACIMCLCTIWMPGTHRGQKRSLDTLELELQIVVALWLLGLEPCSSRRKSGPIYPALVFFLKILFYFYVHVSVYMSVWVL